MGWNVSGMDGVFRKKQAGQKRAPVVFDQEIYRGGQKILSASIKVTPRDTGALRGSGTVNKIDGGVEIGFGGAASAYAMIVHEKPANYSVGGIKYLETPFNQMAPAVIENAFRRAGNTLRGS